MEVDLHAVKEVLDGVEASLKEAVRENRSGISAFHLGNQSYLLTALSKVQEAIAELLQFR